MPQVQKPTVDKFIEKLQERYNNLVNSLTKPDTINENIDLFYEIDLQEMYLARDDLVTLLKLIQIS